jgi:hypothetical protein
MEEKQRKREEIQRMINSSVDSPLNQELLFIFLGNAGVTQIINIREITLNFYLIDVIFKDDQVIKDLEVIF